MEIGSDKEDGATSGGDGKKKIDHGNDALAKPKRQMKTPFQLETLEKVYSVETYPSEAIRAELSEKLGLTDRQLQMWFCHRRLKDKKDALTKKQKKSTMSQRPDNDLPVKSVPEHDSGSGSGCSPYSDTRKNFASGSNSSRAELAEYEPTGRINSDPRISMIVRRAIACIEAQLGEPLREDGPILGMEFDPLPPDAFGTPIVTPDTKKGSSHLYGSDMYDPHNARPGRPQAGPHSSHDQSHDDPSLRPEMYERYPETHAHDMEYEITPSRSSLFVHGNGALPRSRGIHGNISRNRSTSRQAMPSPFRTSGLDDDSILPENDSFDLGPADDVYSDVHRKGKSDKVRLSQESEVRGRKELERLEIQRKKNDERTRKEIERHERERRKEEERLTRERQREEERSQREQKREMERREKFLQRELERAEKKRQKEELRQEKEATRRKIAIERATARRIAKEAMDLIEDEQLELMEIAAATKGLPSILLLDHDTLENLELFKDSLSTFPPKSVQLKMPFAMPPWKDSEENVGNLLMVWRFLVSFADVLGLWPFTLDEFVQAFHDFESRLLGEIHISLLRSIIRDIQDVARTPISASGNNQYTVANPEGGHPQLVEGAYTWGFDICSWQKHLNPLTWPEILRQLALSAGLGPKLTKRNSRLTYLGDKDEVKACEDTISTIRNGSAAENAFALMREKGLLQPRKSRHRLTPGTVKFAAFHVLSLEGSDGLTVLELADKIQKSGLRDLTTSRTPEASISVALTRDVKLFERIAPSTYCVKAPYRKDPEDAEAILAEARKKIRAFENGLTGAEEVERDEDSEGDVDEDPEVDDMAMATANASKSAVDPGEENNVQTTDKENMICDVKADLESEIEKDPSLLPSSSMNAGVQCIDDKDKEVEIDENDETESWIHGLTEGDYCDLSVEERLKALVVLIGIANEGNSIRAVLEDRMEAANSLKKQMWAHAQLDKNCMRDIIKLDMEYLSGNRAEQKADLLMDEEKKAMEIVSNDLHRLPIDNTGQEHVSSQQGYASKRSRSQLKSYIGQRAEEMYVYRSLPLGQDRRHNRYWQFATSASRHDLCSGIIFVELHDSKWRLIDSEEAFEALVTSLDMRGTRESHLYIMLRKIEASFKENVRNSSRISRKPCLKEIGSENEMAEADSSTPNALRGSNPDSAETSNVFRVELGGNDAEKTNLLKRYEDFWRWMWSECSNSLPVFARKYGKMKNDKLLAVSEDSSLPLGHELLKAIFVFLEASIPDEALESFWIEDKRKSWASMLNDSLSPTEHLQVLTLLENAIKREYLSSGFVTAKELFGGDSGTAGVLPWIPLTVSAIALRLLELDASIKYEKPDLTLEDDEDNEIRLSYENSQFRSRTYRDGELKQGVAMGAGNGRNKRGRVRCDSASRKKMKRNKTASVPTKSIDGVRNVGMVRGKRTDQRRVERNVDDNSHAGGRMADIVMPMAKEEEEEEEEAYRGVEDWADVETPSRMMMTSHDVDVDDDDDDVYDDDDDDIDEDASNSMEGERNWGLDWKGNQDDDDVEVSASSEEDGLQSNRWKDSESYSSDS